MLRRLLDSPWFYFGMAGLLALIGLASTFEIRRTLPKGTPADLFALSEQAPINVIFILIDTLRADHLSSYGYERETSPFMDELARGGVRFARAESQSSWTKASMASLWLSSYPERTGVTRYSHGVPEDARMPAEVFRDAGYRTAGVYRNGWVEENFGFAQGFEVYMKPHPSRNVQAERRTPSSHPLQGTDMDATEGALEFIRLHGHQPFFLYVHYMDVHQYLYDETSALFGTSYEDAYDNAIHWTDRNIQILVNELRLRDLKRNTLIVIASDHGESFYEHGLEGHARTLYREVTQTPLLVIPPFEMTPGLVVPETVANVDIWPTVFELIGLDPVGGVEGRSMVPLMRRAAGFENGAEEWDAVAFSQLDRTWGSASAKPLPMVSVVQGPYRLIRSGKQVELFDRDSDPEERHDISEARQETVEELSARLDEYLARPEASWGPAPESELDELRLQQLRALGYVVGD